MSDKIYLFLFGSIKIKAYLRIVDHKNLLQYLILIITTKHKSNLN